MSLNPPICRIGYIDCDSSLNKSYQNYRINGITSLSKYFEKLTSNCLEDLKMGLLAFTFDLDNRCSIAANSESLHYSINYKDEYCGFSKAADLLEKIREFIAIQKLTMPKERSLLDESLISQLIYLSVFEKFTEDKRRILSDFILFCYYLEQDYYEELITLLLLSIFKYDFIKLHLADENYPLHDSDHIAFLEAKQSKLLDDPIISKEMFKLRNYLGIF